VGNIIACAEDRRGCDGSGVVSWNCLRASNSANGFRTLGTVPNGQSPQGKFARISIPAMTPEERQLVNDLCKRIAEEKDASIFHQLVEQLDELLARKEKRLNAARPPDSE
jgi:ribosome recycling factor